MRPSLALILSTTLGVVSASALQATRPHRERFFVEPPSTVITVIASQPDCGLEFTKALVIHGVEGGSGHIYQVRNRSAKAVKSYQISTVTSSGAGADWSYEIQASDKPFLPGEMRPRSLEDLNVELVPLTNELAKKFRTDRPVGIVVFVVVRVTYVDGTEYNGTKEYQALKDFFQGGRTRSAR